MKKFNNVVLFLIPSLIWGSTWYVIKFQIGNTNPLYSVGYRFLLSAIILLIFCLATSKNLKLSARSHFFIFLQGACLFGLNYWLVYMSEVHLTSGLVAVIFSCLIFANVLLSAIFLKKPVSRNVMLGGLIGITGVALIFKNELSTFSLDDDNFVAFLMAIGSVILASTGNILSAYNQKNYLPVIQTNAFGMLYGSMLMLGIGLISGIPITIDLNVSYLGSLMYLSLFGSIIAFSVYLHLLGKIGPDKSGYVSLIIPGIALLISTMMEGYTWTTEIFVGFLLIMGGIFVALRKKKLKVSVPPVKV